MQEELKAPPTGQKDNGQNKAADPLKLTTVVVRAPPGTTVERQSMYDDNSHQLFNQYIINSRKSEQYQKYLRFIVEEAEHDVQIRNTQ